jgi:hypothetical protein
MNALHADPFVVDLSMALKTVLANVDVPTRRPLSTQINIGGLKALFA